MKPRVVLSPAALSFLAAMILMPTLASAQITTFVPPPRKVDSVKQAIVAEQRTKTDSVARMTLTDMKAWVDSAAGVAETVGVVVDTAAPATPVPVKPRPPVGATTTTFSDGAVAPDTASPLPLLALAGLVSLIAGVVLLSGRRRT